MKQRMSDKEIEKLRTKAEKSCVGWDKRIAKQHGEWTKAMQVLNEIQPDYKDGDWAAEERFRGRRYNAELQVVAAKGRLTSEERNSQFDRSVVGFATAYLLRADAVDRITKAMELAKGVPELADVAQTMWLKLEPAVQEKTFAYDRLLKHLERGKRDYDNYQVPAPEEGNNWTWA